MIGVNELLEAQAHQPEILRPLAILASPVAPHLAEELWQMAGGDGSVMDQPWPESNEQWLVSDTISYPVSFNGKVRFKLEVANGLEAKEVEELVLAHEKTKAQLEGKTLRKVIVVPGRIVNLVAN